MPSLRTGAVVAVVAWKLAALALLPAALCCRAVLTAGGAAVPACCEGGEHGAACPMKRAGTEETGAAPDQPRMAGCDSPDDALIALLSLTGFTTDSFDWSADPAAVGGVFDRRRAAVSFDGLLALPPPRS